MTLTMPRAHRKPRHLVGRFIRHTKEEVRKYRWRGTGYSIDKNYLAQIQGHLTSVTCQRCGGPVWTNGDIYWCRTLDCNVGTTLPDGREYIKAEYVPLSHVVRKFEDQ